MTTPRKTATEPWPYGVWEERWPKGGGSLKYNVVDLRNGDRRVTCHKRDEAEKACSLMNGEVRQVTEAEKRYPDKTNYNSGLHGRGVRLYQG